MTTVAQRSFAGGELAPALYARTDQSKYATGLRTCRNLIVQKHGSVRLRPGTGFVGAVKDSAKTVRLLKFVFNDAQTYVMEFGENYIRWMQLGGRLVTSGVAAWVTATVYAIGDLRTNGGSTYYAIAAHTSAAGDQPGVGANWQTYWAVQTGTTYEIPSPYLEADLPALQIVQSADVITIAHPSYQTRDLTRYSHTKWILTPVVHGPSIASPTNLALGGGSAGTIRYWAVTAIQEGSFEESLASLISAINRIPSAGTPTTISWNNVAGAISYNVYRSTDGQTYGLINSAGGTPLTQSDTSFTDNDETATSSVASVWAAAAGQGRNPLTISATTKAYDGKYTVKFRRTLTVAAGGSGARGRVAFYYSRDAEARIFAGYSSEIMLVGSGTAGPTAEQLTIDVPDNGYSALTIDAVPEVLPFSAHTCTMNANFASAPNNEVSWTSGATVFSDAGDAAELSIAPPSQANLFSSADHYPAAITHYQQRTIYGGSNAEPEKVYASRTGSFKSFTTSTPLQADDAVSFALAGREVNAVKHFLDLDLLIAFTSSEVKVIRGDGEQGILRPDAINPKKIAKHGIGTLRPLEVDDSALYVQSRGNIVRDLKPIASENYEGTDLTVFAAHLFDGKTVIDWDYAEVPNSVLWCALSDGTLVALTYLREHNIWAWHRHDTDGEVENVCTVPEGEEDRVYLVVKRIINGATKRYIERMASGFVRDINREASPFGARATVGRFTDMLFMDCLLSYNGWNTAATTLTISGGTNWDELEQLTVTASLAGTFVAGDVGNAVFVTLTDADGVEIDRIRLIIEQFTSGTIVLARPDRTVPAGFRTISRSTWAKAVDQVTGLSHLEGKAVSVLADGYVVASPNNTVEEYEAITVSGGAITLEQPYAVIHVGLPYIGDLETLDIDLPGPRTVKDKKVKVDRALMMLEATRGLFVGPGWGPTIDDPLENMQEAKVRDEDDDYGPIDLRTGDLEVLIEGSWDSNGRLLVRQVDPLPVTILSIAPIMSG